MARVPERVGVDPHDWHAADKAYQLHHTNCPTCIAAGMAPGKRERCQDGAALWATYQQAGDPPHFAWLRKRQGGKKQ